MNAMIAATLRLGLGGRYDAHVASFDRRNLWFGVTRVTTVSSAPSCEATMRALPALTPLT